MDQNIAQIIIVVSNAALAVTALVSAYVAFRQFRSVRDEAAKNRTLEICNRYENDPILDGVVRRLRAHEHGVISPEYEYRIDVIVLLNYLDSISIGINKNLYVGEIVKKRMCCALKGHVDEYLMNDELVRQLDINVSDFSNLLSVYHEWCQPLDGECGCK